MKALTSKMGDADILKLCNLAESEARWRHAAESLGAAVNILKKKCEGLERENLELKNQLQKIIKKFDKPGNWGWCNERI